MAGSRVLVSCIFAILEVVSLWRDFFGFPRGLFPVCWGFCLYAMLYAMRTVFDHATISIIGIPILKAHRYGKFMEAIGLSALIFDGLYGSSILSSLLFTLGNIKCLL